MISARAGRTDITNILLEGEHIDLDIQENVSVYVYLLLIMTDDMASCPQVSYCLLDTHTSIVFGCSIVSQNSPMCMGRERDYVHPSLVPKPHPLAGKGLVTFEQFLGCAESAVLT